MANYGYRMSMHMDIITQYNLLYINSYGYYIL